MSAFFSLYRFHLLCLIIVPFFFVFSTPYATAAEEQAPPNLILKLEKIVVFFEKKPEDPTMHFMNIEIFLEFKKTSDLDFFRTRSSAISEDLKTAFRAAGYEALAGPKGTNELKKLAYAVLIKNSGAPVNFQILINEITIR